MYNYQDYIEPQSFCLVELCVIAIYVLKIEWGFPEPKETPLPTPLTMLPASFSSVLLPFSSIKHCFGSFFLLLYTLNYVSHSTYNCFHIRSTLILYEKYSTVFGFDSPTQNSLFHMYNGIS